MVVLAELSLIYMYRFYLNDKFRLFLYEYFIIFVFMIDLCKLILTECYC